MTDHFDKWINGMTENEYEDWLEDIATEAQEESALNIRTPLSEQEEADMLKEQIGEEELPEEPISRIEEIETEPEPRSRIQEVSEREISEREIYDNRDLPPERFTADVILRPNQPPIIIPKKQLFGTRQPITKPILPSQPVLPQQIPRIQPQQPQFPRVTITGFGTKKPTLRQRISGGFKRFTNIFRRNKK